MPVPEWPLPDTHRETQVVAAGAADAAGAAGSRPRDSRVEFIAISAGGSCAAHGLPLLSASACELLALQQPKHTFIGETREQQECVYRSRSLALWVVASLTLPCLAWWLTQRSPDPRTLPQAPGLHPLGWRFPRV